MLQFYMIDLFLHQIILELRKYSIFLTFIRSCADSRSSLTKLLGLILLSRESRAHMNQVEQVIIASDLQENQIQMADQEEPKDVFDPKQSLSYLVNIINPRTKDLEQRIFVADKTRFVTFHRFFPPGPVQKTGTRPPKVAKAHLLFALVVLF